MTQQPIGSVSDELKVPWTGYIALGFAILFFSGIFASVDQADPTWGWLRIFDFSTVSGQFGTLGTLAADSGKLAPNFVGLGGTGPKHALLFALTIVPSIMFALGVVKIVENYGGLLAGQKLLTPLMRVAFGLPGITTLPLIAGLQNSDTGASIIKQLNDENFVTEKEKMIFIAFHYSAPAIILNYFALASMNFPYMKVAISLPLVVILICKYIGANLFRFLLADRMLRKGE